MAKQIKISALGLAQREYSQCIAKLIQKVAEEGYSCTLSEGFVGDTDAKDGDHDGPHRADGGHYRKLAMDINVFKGDIWMDSGNEEIWPILGRFWTSLHRLARWNPKDANHFGFMWNGVY